MDGSNEENMKRKRERLRRVRKTVITMRRKKRGEIEELEAIISKNPVNHQLDVSVHRTYQHVRRLIETLGYLIPNEEVKIEMITVLTTALKEQKNTPEGLAHLQMRRIMIIVYTKKM